MRAPAAASLSSPLLLLAAVVALALLLAAGPSRVAASPLCPPCEGGSCDVDPADCRHGVVRDHCGRQVCAKGPGQRCGGKGDLLGRCGEGMHCKCNRCAGCSLATLECDLSEFLCLS
ncbi:hypothetical protein R5R35_007061 [Gryllus longicercus]|uniref:Neuroparsin n=1 Tax=Gryllus longicercus TaxID=2509291 RepID=A0AAN9YX15_9ORTH